jgi:molybdate transport system regulatory protein
MATPPARPRLRFRLVLGRSIAVGPGKADLLAAIEATGSITAAGRAMGMSYKRAWYLLDTMNRCFREPLVAANKGGKGHGGAQLTPMGKQVLALYRAIEAEAARAAAAELETLARLVVETPPEPG